MAGGARLRRERAAARRRDAAGDRGCRRDARRARRVGGANARKPSVPEWAQQAGRTACAASGDADDAAPRAPTDSVRARVVINCAGLYGDIVESWRPGGGAADGEWRMAHCDSQVGADAAFHITPRKGQFVVLAPPAGATPPRAVLELVPTQFTKGVIVWTTVWGHRRRRPHRGAADVARRPSHRRANGARADRARRKVCARAQGCDRAGDVRWAAPRDRHRDYQIRRDADGQRLRLDHRRWDSVDRA